MIEWYWLAIFVVLLVFDSVSSRISRRRAAHPEGEYLRFGCVPYDGWSSEVDARRPPEVFRYHRRGDVVASLRLGEEIRHTTHRADSLTVGDALFTRTVVDGEEFRRGDLLVICAIEHRHRGRWRQVPMRPTDAEKL